jgi:uncharacterized protein (TIGR02118 family)
LRASPAAKRRLPDCPTGALKNENPQETMQMIKLIEIMKRKEGLTLEAFTRHWEETHGPLIQRTIPHIRRYVQNHALRLPGGGEPPIDGVAEIWYDDFESWRASAKWVFGPTGKEIQNDEDNFIDKGRTYGFICIEKVIKA